MDICIVIGSIRKESSTKKILENIIENAFEKNEISNINWHNLSEYKLDSDYKKHIKKIKRDLLSSDIIFFASPVYVNNVSGYMKFLIEELVLWTHLMRLAGKKGIALTVSDRGNKFAEDYMKFFLSYMGVDVVCSYSLTPKDMNSINDISKEIYDKVTQAKIPTNELLEILFSRWNEEIKLGKKTISEDNELHLPEEILYWDRNNLWQYNSFKELVEDIERGKILYEGAECDV